ncbi:hypothetical protein [Haliangium ochraceum]|uniref:Uncharacterized protein n=1 Tax=Haliangium ochraceum (strain DSM 14365 / JCM 11303 / SMP-2) TaxID=502025 RepID=D0LY29_HALO1|nr:hypothetical protein [Haliangium ochraceum]ACY14384.1 conserved hypothetical protein [Haliangium ochraceum DSM 14365]
MRILVLTEDANKDALTTITALVKKLCQLADEGCQTQKIRCEPGPDNIRAIARGNAWKANGRRQERVELIRELATRLTEEPVGFALFHIDGDRPWSQRDSSENCAQFASKVRDKVRELLKTKRPHWDEEQLDRSMARLILLCPFYSIEAWTYQNIALARRLCKERYGGRDATRFDAWERERASIDEIEQLKDAVCLRDKHNHELATTAYPHRAVYEAGASFAAAADALRANEQVREALRATQPSYGTSLPQ